jgi:hypothetical protein
MLTLSFGEVTGINDKNGRAFSYRSDFYNTFCLPSLKKLAFLLTSPQSQANQRPQPAGLVL